MATAKPYDPVVSIEGMYHGSVTRIAYALKDPGNFGQSTKAIIQECSKQFHDALDDCEIQIIDAKWYLEHQLELRKEQRAAKAREEQVATAKRKHDQVETDGDREKDKDTKRQKVEQPSKPPSEPVKSEAMPEQPPAPEPAQQPAKADKPAEPGPPEEEKKPEKPSTPAKEDPAPHKPPETIDDLFGSGRPTPSADPGTAGLDGADDFNQFESMFGEPTADDSNLNPDGELGFDLQMGDDDFAANINDGNPDQGAPSGEASGLDSLLPGLDSYANQDATGGATAGGTANSNSNAAVQSGTGSAVDFNLPELGGPNEFDAFLDANNFDGIDLNADPNLEGDLNNMDAPLDFESMFS